MTEIKAGYIPGAVGRVVEMHGRYYHHHWGFGFYFEAKVATELVAFFNGYKGQRDGFWTVHGDGQIQGSIAIDGADAEKDGAHLRWFIVSDEFRGRGLGIQLLAKALDFCSDCHYERVYLWTFEGLEAARHLYEGAGFTLVTEQPGNRWGKTVTEQLFERRF